MTGGQNKLERWSLESGYKADQGILKGKYHCTIDLLFDWFRLACFANRNKNCK
jgi:hypothetical protein